MDKGGGGMRGMSTGRVILIGLVLGTGVLSFIPARVPAAGDSGGSQDESVAGEAQASAPLLARLRAQFSERQAFRSPFVQTSHWAAFDEADTSSGSLIVAPPDRFRLEYLEPAGHLIGSDGRFVWTFLPEDRQVLRAHIEETTNWGGFFYEALEEAADSLALFHADAEHGTVARIALRSRPEWGVNDLYVEVSPREALPVGYGYADEEGNRFRFSFHEPQFLPAVDENLFRFRTPEGYELFEVD